MSFAEIFSPGLRHWKEFQDEQATKELQVPATGPGPGDVTVDLDKGVIVIPQTPPDESESADSVK